MREWKTPGRNRWAWAMTGLVLLWLAACSPRGGGVASSPGAEGRGTSPAAQAPAAATKPVVKPLDPPVEVRVGTVQSTTDAPLFIAEDRGYFKELGLAVKTEIFKTAADMVAPITTGELDVGAGGISAGLFNAAARKISLKVVALKTATSKGHSTNALVVRKDLYDGGEVRSFSDLKGRTVTGACTGCSVEIELDAGLRKAGLTSNDVNLVALGFPDMNVAFANKSIDAAIQTEPLLTLGAERGLFVKLAGVDEMLPDHNGFVWFYSPKFADEKTEAARLFMVALVKGMRDYADAFDKDKNKEDIISILTKSTTVKDESLWRRMTPVGVNPDGYVTLQSLVKDQDWYFERGLVKEKIDVNQLVDHRFVDFAIQALGKYR